MPASLGLADLYRVLVDLQAGMAEIRLHMERIDTRNEFADRQAGDFETRLRVIEATSPGQRQGDTKELAARVEALERFRYTLAGGLALVALIFAGLGTWIASALTQH